MGKQDLINQLAKDRSKWPAEAKVCEKLWILTKKLRESNLMEDYLAGKIDNNEVDILLREHDNSNMIQDIKELQQECFRLIPELTTQVRIIPKPGYFKILSEIGTVLAKSNWWDRYETITRTMGVECVLSIRTAESLFKRDPYAVEIKTLLEWLIREEV